ncbi:MAG: M28 family peptidase [Bacteroidales bacterium]|nr:M28 family peptidase [Bacteroidales bacterium]
MARFARLLTVSPRWGILCVSITFLFSLSSFTLRAQDSSYARRIIRDLSSEEMFGRGMQNRGDSIAAEYLRQEMMANGVKPLCKNYFQYFRFPQTRTKPPIVKAGYQSQNVCGYIPGETDTMIVFTAHYEHLGMNGDTVFYGAHDNASGTAAVMDLARMANLQRGHYTYVFLLFSGEESGLVGSRYFSENPLIQLSKVKLLVNIDLFCGGADGLMVVNANSRETRPFVDKLEAINDLHGFAAKIARRDNAANSDHYWFTSECPAIFIYTMGGPFGGYHSPTDTCDGCGLGNYHRHMTLLRAFLEQL